MFLDNTNAAYNKLTKNIQPPSTTCQHLITRKTLRENNLNARAWRPKNPNPISQWLSTIKKPTNNNTYHS